MLLYLAIYPKWLTREKNKEKKKYHFLAAIQESTKGGAEKECAGRTDDVCGGTRGR